MDAKLDQLNNNPLNNIGGHANMPALANGHQRAATTNGHQSAAVDGVDDDDSLYEMLEAVDISGQIPANFYTQMESKKWSERKEALDVIEKVTMVPKIQNCDFKDFISVLKKTVSKDSNIVVVTSAAKCLCQLAQGLRINFAPHATSCLRIIFEKFKEKKPNVISVMRDTADATFVATNLEEIFEDVIKFLDNKNPQIKSEMALFLTRTFSNNPAQVKNKKLLRPLINALIKTLSDMDATVRDNSAMAIGTAMKVVGENLMMPIIADVEPIKIAKIKEFYEKAEIKTTPVNGRNGHANMPGLANGQPAAARLETNELEEDGDDEDRLYDMLEAVDISNQIPANFYTQMESKKWSERKEALDVIEKVTSVPKIQNSDFNELIGVLKKTVSKDSNIVVVTSAAKCLCQLAKGLRTNFGPHATSCLRTIFEKFKEKKPNVISVMRDAADATFVATNLEEIFEDVIKFLDNKNPQIKSEMALFLARTFSNNPVQVYNKKLLRPLTNALIKTLSDMDSTVRDNSALAIGTAMKVVGENLMMTLIADVEPIKITKIKEFCEKAEVKKVPKSVLHAAIKAQAPPPAPVQAAPPQRTTSSATMVRSTSNKRLSTKIGGPAKPPVSNATVKRTATIIKRTVSSTATNNKRASGLAQPPTIAPPQVTPTSANSTTSATAAAATTTTMPPPQLPQLPQPAQVPTHVQVAAAIPQHVSTPEAPRSSRQENFDLTLFRLISDNNDEVLDSIAELESLADGTLVRSRINQIIDLLCLQLIKCVSQPPDPQRLSIVCKCLTKLFGRPKLVTNAGLQSIRFLLVQLFTITQKVNQEDLEVVNSLNGLSSAIMDSYEPTNMMNILTGLLNDPTPTSIVEPIKRAIIRSMKSFN